MAADKNAFYLENLTKQLEEIEMISAMFPGEEELTWNDPSLMVDAEEYRDSHGESQPTHHIQTLQFDLNLKITPCSEEHELPIKLSIQLPKDYPTVRPELSVSSPHLDRHGLTSLKSELNEFMLTLQLDEQILLDIIFWLQQNATKHFSNTEALLCQKEIEVEKAGGGDEELMSMWMYMHHIYSKHKRKDIVNWSHDYSLTGFSLPGKPGVVYIEGPAQSAEDYFDKLRALPWKSIKCFRKEACAKRVFEDFKELCFEPHGARNYHMDFGLFYQFLLEHDLGHMFKEIFGVEGQIKD